MSAKSSVMPPKRKLEKFVMATALNVKNAAKITAFIVIYSKPAMMRSSPRLKRKGRFMY